MFVKKKLTIQTERLVQFGRSLEACPSMCLASVFIDAVQTNVAQTYAKLLYRLAVLGAGLRARAHVIK